MAAPSNSSVNYPFIPLLSSSTAPRIVTANFFNVCLTILGVCLGTRFKYHFMRPNLVRLLSLGVYWCNICFIFAVGTVASLVELHGAAACRTTSLVCFALYAWTRTITYIVFIARARSLAAESFFKDYKFLLGAGVFLLGYGMICGFVFSHPKEEYQMSDDGHCKIGLPNMLTIPILVVDFIVNILACLVFLIHLHRHLERTAQLSQRQMVRLSLRAVRATIPFTKPDQRYFTPSAQPEYHAAKTLVASLLLMMGTVGNLVTLIAFNGHEDPWLCISTCLANSTAACLAVHYVTSSGPYAKVLRRQYNEMHEVTRV